MKIFSYTASYRSDSNTGKVIDLVVGNIGRKEKVIWYNHSARTDNICECQGCTCCFKEGMCALDATDGMKIIRAELLDAEVIILGSPVYAAMVSGNMKKLIDRLSCHLHTISMRGKIIIPVLSASSNSLMEANVYLKKIAESWGGTVPFSILFTTDAPNMLESASFMKKIGVYSDEIIEYVTNGKRKVASGFQETYYTQLKRIFALPGDDAERRYWRKSGLLDYQSYQEILDTEKR